MSKLEIITQYEKNKPTKYSFDSGKSWLKKSEYKKQIHRIKKSTLTKSNRKD